MIPNGPGGLPTQAGAVLFAGVAFGSVAPWRHAQPGRDRLVRRVRVRRRPGRGARRRAARARRRSGQTLVTRAFAAAGTQPILWEAFDQLIGEGRWWRRRGVGGSIPVRFPSQADPGDAGWHI